MENNTNQQNNNNNPQNNNKKPNKNTGFTILIIAIILTVLVNFASVYMFTKTTQEISYSKFLSMVKEGKVEKVEVQSGKIIIYPKDKAPDENNVFKIGSPKQKPFYTGRFPDLTLKEDLEK